VQLIDGQVVGLQLRERHARSRRHRAGAQGRDRDQAPEAATLNTGIEIQVPEYVGSARRCW
jgi:hypothetical protein